MPMVGWIRRPETCVSGVFEDFSVRMVLLFGLYGTYGIATASAGSADWDGRR